MRRWAHKSSNHRKSPQLTRKTAMSNTSQQRLLARPPKQEEIATNLLLLRLLDWIPHLHRRGRGCHYLVTQLGYLER